VYRAGIKAAAAAEAAPAEEEAAAAAEAEAEAEASRSVMAEAKMKQRDKLKLKAALPPGKARQVAALQAMGKDHETAHVVRTAYPASDPVKVAIADAFTKGVREDLIGKEKLPTSTSSKLCLRR